VDWSDSLLQSIQAGKVATSEIPESVVRRIAVHRDPKIVDTVRTLWGEIKGLTPAEAQDKIDRAKRVLEQSGGTPYAGHQVFNKACARCHKLFSEGGDVGPDLTSYKRIDLDNMLLAIVHPSAEIREGFETFQIFTTDGRAITGFLADQDAGVVVVRTAEGQSFTIERTDMDEMEKSPKSVMPDGLLDPLSDQEIRDLFAYLRSTQPLSQ
jgi:putative heme-binding domain-containing protein